MGSEISAGQLLRPLDASRPAEPPARTDSGGERFQTYLETARTTQSPRHTESPRRGEPTRERKPVDRDEPGSHSPESAQSQPAPQLTADQPPAENETGDDSVTESTAAVASTESASPPARAQVQTGPANPAVPLMQEMIVSSLPKSPVSDTDDGSNDSSTIQSAPAPTPTEPKQLARPQPVKEIFPVIQQAPVVFVADADESAIGENESTSPAEKPARVREGSPESLPADRASIPIDALDIETVDDESKTVAPRLISQSRAQQRPIEKSDLEPRIQKTNELVPGPNEMNRTSRVRIERAEPIGPGPRHLNVTPVDSDEKPVEAKAEPTRPPRVFVRSGSGDSAAAVVARFLIETTSDGEPTTANVPPQVNVQAPSLPSPSSAAHRATAEPSKTADVTVTTLARLLVSGTEGSDSMDSAAQVLSGSQRPGNHHVTLQLDPPELGKLRLDIRMQRQEMTLRVAVDNASVANLIESRLSDLRDALATHGIRIDRSDVVIRPHLAEGANPQTSQHGGSAGTTNGGGDRADQPDVARADDHRWGAGREDQAGADRRPTGHSIFSEEETAVAPTSWEPITEGAGVERTWVDLVA